MSIIVTENTQGEIQYLLIEVKGVLSLHDYLEVENQLITWPYQLAQPAIAMVDCRLLKGWQWRALWADIAFSWRYRSCFRGFVVVGDRRWQKLGCRCSQLIMAMPIQFCESVSLARECLHELAAETSSN